MEARPVQFGGLNHGDSEAARQRRKTAETAGLGRRLKVDRSGRSGWVMALDGLEASGL